MKKKAFHKHWVFILIVAPLFVVLISSFLQRGCSEKRAVKQSGEIKDSPGANINQAGRDINNYYGSIALTDTRPYLSIELRPGRNEWLRKDGNSNLFLICCYTNSHLILPFKLRNVGKIHAVKIEAKYSSPDQDFEIELGEKSDFLATDDEIPETLRPHINVSNVSKDENVREFEIEIVLNYQRYDKNDSPMYNTVLKLVLVRHEVNEQVKAYIIKESNLTFGETSEDKEVGLN